MLLAPMLECPIPSGLVAALMRTRWSRPRSCWIPLALLLVGRLLLEVLLAARWAAPAAMLEAVLLGSPVCGPSPPKQKGRKMRPAK